MERSVNDSFNKTSSNSLILCGFERKAPSKVYNLHDVMYYKEVIKTSSSVNRMIIMQLDDVFPLLSEWCNLYLKYTCTGSRLSSELVNNDFLWDTVDQSGRRPLHSGDFGGRMKCDHDLATYGQRRSSDNSAPTAVAHSLTRKSENRRWNESALIPDCDIVIIYSSPVDFPKLGKNSTSHSSNYLVLNGLAYNKIYNTEPFVLLLEKV